MSVIKYSESKIVIEKSVFIASVSPVNGEDEAKKFVSEVRAKYPDATHNCYAYVADIDGLQVKFSDDGEPQGTAGMPILEVLKNKKLFKTCVVITRYFGGVKLGAGGLVRAYSECTTKGVEDAKIKEFILSGIYTTKLHFSLYQKFLKFLNSLNCVIKESVFDSDGVSLTFYSPKFNEEKLSTAILDFSSGKSTLTIQNYDFFGYNL